LSLDVLVNYHKQKMLNQWYICMLQESCDNLKLSSKIWFYGYKEQLLDTCILHNIFTSCLYIYINLM